MKFEKTKSFCESKGIVFKGDFFDSLASEEKTSGYIKFNLPEIHEYLSDEVPKNGEGVWGWVTESDKEKYFDNNYTGEITAILLNEPICDFAMLPWGTEITLKCNGAGRPVPSPDWVREKIIDSGWYKDYFG